MRRDKDCPYKNHCHDAPEGCEECDWHLAFEKFRRRLTRIENRLSRTKALLEMYRGVEGCRLHEMMDAELQGRCLTLPTCTPDDIEELKELYDKFMFELRLDPPQKGAVAIAESIERFLKGAVMAAVVKETRKKEEQ